MRVSIYTKTGDPHTLSAGKTPDASIGQLVGPDPSVGGTFTYTAPDITLNPGTYYYIVATAGTPNLSQNNPHNPSPPLPGICDHAAQYLGTLGMNGWRETSKE